MKKLLLFLLVAPLILLGQQTARELYYSGNEKYILKEYRGAIADYTKYIKLKPKDPDAYLNRADAKYNLKQYHGAIADCIKAIELDPDYAYAYYTRGDAKFELEDYKGAIADYTKFIEIEPNNTDAYNKREEALKKDNTFNYPLILIVILIIVILIIIYNNRKKKTPVSKPIEKKKTSESGPLLFKASIEGFIEKMKEISDWYQIIQARGNGHAMMVDIGIKVDDYEYWSNAHKEEYMIKHNNGDLDVEGINLRIEKFRFIVSEFEKVIKKAAELKFNITTEMANDYHAARASVLGAEKALKEMSPKAIDTDKNIKNEGETSIIRVNLNDTNDIGDITHYEGKPFNGVGFMVHENGELKIDCPFKDGLKHGKTVEFYDNGQIKYEYTNVDDEFDKIISAFLENGEKKPFILSTLKSRKRLTYVIRSEENGEDVQEEIESVSSTLGFTDEFYKLNDWEQIEALTEAFKKTKDEKLFGTWVVNEFRFMEYSFKNEFKIKFAEQLIKFYQDDLSIKQLKEYFDNNVIWKDK
jgi:tetratricopeptide (TPR) repeat protein